MAKKTSTRNQLLETAARLFYQNGYHAIGVDTITSQSCIGKMTLYRHFDSKDDLILAYLQESDALFWQAFEKATCNVVSASGKLVAFFQALEAYVTRPDCFGCPFLNIAAEYPDPDYPGHKAAREHKEAVRQRFRDLAAQAGACNPDVLADQLLLLMDGAYMAGRMYHNDSPAVNVAGAASALIAAQIDRAAPLSPALP